MSFGSRPLGMVIRTLYPLAYATWQDAVFHVNGLGPLPGISADAARSRTIDRELAKNTQLLKKAYERIKFDLQDMTEKLIEEWDEDDDGEPITQLNVVVPQSITLRLDTSLDVVYCDRCHALSRLSKIGRNTKSGLPLHRNCKHGGRFRQAPVFVPRPEGTETVGLAGEPGAAKVKSISPYQIVCKYLRTGGRCEHPDTKDDKCDPRPEQQLSYLEINPQRPLSGLRIINPHCPKGLTNIPPQKVSAPRVGPGSYYAKRFPSPGITSPLFVTIADEDTKTTDDIDYVNSYIQEVKKTLFNPKFVDIDNTQFSKINVLELVYGLRVGGSRFGGYTEHWMDGGENNNVLGRMMKTRGFVITIKPEIYEKINEIIDSDPKLQEKDDPEHYVLDIVVHTLKHAMLVLVPQFTGYEDQKFMGAYEILDDKKGAKIYLYDNENGGHGGFATLIKDVDRFSDMIKRIVGERLKCPVRECKHACGNCLFIRRCGKINRDLNRHYLARTEIFQPQIVNDKF